MIKLGIKAAVALGAVPVLLAASTASSQAVSKSVPYYYAGGKHTLQANVWLGAGQTFGYQTSTKYLGSAYPSLAKSIKNTANISVTGIGVSLGNASGGTSSDKDFSTSWTNYNAWISDRAGTNSVSNNFYLYISGGSVGSADVPYYGSPRTVSASVQKYA